MNNVGQMREARLFVTPLILPLGGLETLHLAFLSVQQTFGGRIILFQLVQNIACRT